MFDADDEQSLEVIGETILTLRSIQAAMRRQVEERKYKKRRTSRFEEEDDADDEEFDGFSSDMTLDELLLQARRKSVKDRERRVERRDLSENDLSDLARWCQTKYAASPAWEMKRFEGFYYARLKNPISTKFFRGESKRAAKRAVAQWIRANLMHDVEMNPGPGHLELVFLFMVFGFAVAWCSSILCYPRTIEVEIPHTDWIAVTCDGDILTADAALLRYSRKDANREQHAKNGNSKSTEQNLMIHRDRDWETQY